jgi:hypothetical protein
MRNKITDLNNHLFAQLERLNDEDLTPEQQDIEIRRAHAITGIAKNIVENNKVVMNFLTLAEKAGMDISKINNPIGLLPHPENNNV